MLLSIVIPCYNSEKTIREVVELSMEEIRKIPDMEPEFILVNDYSKDGTYREICALAREYPCVHGISFAKNFGQHNAIMAGMRAARGDYIMGMDDDMQTHPSQIRTIVEKMNEGYDVVFGIFRKRKFGFMKNLTSRIASFILWHMVERPKGIDNSNFWCCRRYVRDEVIRYNGYSLYLQMLFFRTTSNVANVEIEHFRRESGVSNYTFGKLVKVFMSVMNYSIVPLRLATFLGFAFSATGFIASVVILIRKLIEPDLAVGWPSLICVMLLCFGIVFLMMGIMGEYIGRMILYQSRTPQYVIREQTDETDGREEAASRQLPGEERTQSIQ